MSDVCCQVPETESAWEWYTAANMPATRVLLPNDRCLFCESQRKKDVEEWIKCVTKTAEESVREAATRKQDQHIHLKVQGTGLAA